MTRYPLTEERKQLFLKVLSETGSPVAAASAATPWSEHKQGGLNTFRDEARRDLAFAEKWERARQEALAAVEQEIVRRAMEPPTRAIWHKGELVGYTEDRNSSDKLLLRLAARLDPGWRERTTVDANVTMSGIILAIRPSDVLTLNPSEQHTLLDLLEKIADKKGEPDEISRLRSGDDASDGRP